MTFKPVLFAALLLTLGACAIPPNPERPASRIPPFEPAAPALAKLSELARVAALSPEQRRREQADLESGRRDEAKRFSLAALLEREDSVEALERSLKILSSMDEADPRSQALIDLLKRSLKARLDLKQQTTRAQELQDKLEQIKALEKSLQQRNVPPKTP
jgi:hypothetical protein